MIGKAKSIEWYKAWLEDEQVDGRGRHKATHLRNFAPVRSRFAATPSTDEVLGSELSDEEFLRMRDAKLRAAQMPVPSFELAAQKQAARREFRLSKLPTALYAELIAAEEWRLSDKYESIRPGSKDDAWRATVTVRVPKRKLEFDNPEPGFHVIKLQFAQYNRRGFSNLVYNYRVLDSGRVVPIRFSLRAAKWVSDPYAVSLIKLRMKKKLPIF